MAKKVNIILTGFMGTGKTTVGKLLALRLGYEFVDTDELITSRYNMTIARIFQEKGENAFRRIESEIAAELSDREGLVVSTGGKMMLDPANADALGKSGRVFCLTATVDEILDRVSSDPGTVRPLLLVENPRETITELLEQREEGYGRFTRIRTSGRSPERVADVLLGFLDRT